MRHEWIRAGATIFLALAAGGCGGKPGAQQPPPAAVTVSVPLQRQVVDWEEYTGHLQSPKTASVAARISGFIEEVPFKEGALVNKGDTLFVIDDRPFKADLENKRATEAKDAAQVTLTKTELERSAMLLKNRVVEQQDYDTKNAGYQQAQAQLAADKAAADAAALNLEWTRVEAPISGRISKMNITVGNLVNGGAGQATLLTTIVSVDPVYCYVSVPERAFLKYQTAAAREKHEGVREARIPCYVELENETNFPHAGYIDFIDNALDPNTGTIQVRGVIPNPDGMLTPGLFARMRVAGSGRYQALLVPEEAVNTDQNERFLLVVDKENVVQARPVELGRLFGSLRSIVNGLNPGERVVVNGIQMARPGTKVNPRETPIPEEAIRALDVADSGGKTP